MTPCASTKPAFTSSTYNALANGTYTGQSCGVQGGRFCSICTTRLFESNQIMSKGNRISFIQKPQGDSRSNTKSMPRSAGIDARPESPFSHSEGVLARSTVSRTSRIIIRSVPAGCSKIRPIENATMIPTISSPTASLFLKLCTSLRSRDIQTLL